MLKQDLPDGRKRFHSERNESYTKKGPGRKHKQGGDLAVRRAWWDLRKFMGAAR